VYILNTTHSNLSKLALGCMHFVINAFLLVASTGLDGCRVVYVGCFYTVMVMKLCNY